MYLRRCFVLLCLLAQALLSVQVRAHLPEFYGRAYVRAPEPAAAAEPQVPAVAPEDIERLSEFLAATQEREGPYSAALSDPLIQLAALQARSGDTVEALRSYERALHLLRVNNGLLHPVQLPVQRALAEIYAAIDDPRSALLARRSVLRVHGMSEKALHGEALDDALAYFQAARDAFIAPDRRTDRGLLLQAHDDNLRLLEAQLADPGEDFAALRDVALSQLRNLYIVLGTDVPGALGGSDLDSERLLRLQDLALSHGLELLDMLLARLPEEARRERAELLLQRGNWRQWNGHWRGAREDYQTTFDAMDDEPWAAAMRRQLASPAALPEDPLLWRSLQGPAVPRRGRFQASLEVSARGDAMRVRTEALDGASPAAAGQLRRMLADSHFRPALQAGVPVDGAIRGRVYLLLR